MSDSTARPAGRLRPYLFVIVAAVSLQTGSAVATRLFDALGAPGLLALRMGFGALLLVLLTRAWRRAPSPRAWPLVAGFGAVLGLMNLLFYLSIDRIPLGVAVALELLGPLAVAVAGSRSVRDLVWAGVAVVGVGVLVSPQVLVALGLGAGRSGGVGSDVVSGTTQPLDPAGVVLALAAGACWAVYILLGTRVAAAAPGTSSLAWAMVAASVVLVPLGVGTAGTALLDPRLLAAGLAVAVLSAALPYSLELVAMRDVGAQTFGVMMALEPAVASLAGLVVAGQQLAPVTLLGMAVVVVATLAALGRAPRRTPPPHPPLPG